uniref:Uncharacterized protein n=1 Tax=Hemiselmis andersenii TaxID=464988 RepID=A0A7S1EJN7_HEMAN
MDEVERAALGDSARPWLQRASAPHQIALTAAPPLPVPWISGSGRTLPGSTPSVSSARASRTAFAWFAEHPATTTKSNSEYQVGMLAP